MAAVLLKGCFKPCEWCAEGCAKCCNAMGKCIGKCCDFLQPCCDYLGNLFDAPFSGCVFFALLLNVVPFIVSIYFLIADWDLDCDKPLQTWLLVMVFLFIANVVLAAYLIRKIVVEDMENLKGDSDFDKLCNFLMYDYVVAVYILVAIFGFVWVFIGVGWVADEGDDKLVANCADTDFHDFTRACVIIMLVYLFGGIFIVLLTMCHACDCLWDCIFASSRNDREKRRERRQRRVQERQQRIRERKDRSQRDYATPMHQTGETPQDRPPAYNPTVARSSDSYGRQQQQQQQQQRRQQQQQQPQQSQTSAVTVAVASGVATAATAAAKVTASAAKSLAKWVDKKQEQRKNQQP